MKKEVKEFRKWYQRPEKKKKLQCMYKENPWKGKKNGTELIFKTIIQESFPKIKEFKCTMIQLTKNLSWNSQLWDWSETLDFKYIEKSSGMPGKNKK